MLALTARLASGPRPAMWTALPSSMTLRSAQRGHPRAQAAVVAGAPPQLLLLDLVDVQAAQQRGAPSPEEPSGAPGLALLPDLAVPERVFVRTATAVWAVTLTWLPALVNFLEEGAPASCSCMSPFRQFLTVLYAILSW